MAFEVGNVVKIMISNQPWRGVIVTYTNDNPPIYEVRVDDLKQIFTAKEDELSLLSESSGGGGGGSTGLIVRCVESFLDKTWQEIYDVFSTGRPVVIIDTDEISGVSPLSGVVNMAKENSTQYVIRSLRSSGMLTYSAESADDYPLAPA